MKKYKLIFTVPITHTQILLDAIGDAGAGVVGNYSRCSFIVRGVGKFLPLSGADPVIGNVGKYEEVIEDQIQVDIDEDNIQKIIAVMKKAHPYEEVAYDVFEKTSL